MALPATVTTLPELFNVEERLDKVTEKPETLIA